MIIGTKEFDFDNNTYLMGILNVTPDSFSDGGLYLDPDCALEHALRMEAEGADLIDVGAESTRPGAEPVSEEEELKRLVPVLKKIAPRLKTPLSIDTRKGRVAEIALEEGAVLVNDISALQDPKMASVVSQKEAPIILMHMKGDPQTMQQNVFYEDVIDEIGTFFRQRIDFALQQGIRKILIDPGIGFGKRIEDNLEITKRLGALKSLECPIVFGSSRKSFIRKTVGPSAILAGSVITALFAAEHGASLLRVHDVKETRQAIHLARLCFFA